MKQSTAKDKAVARLKEAIISGDIPPGEHIAEEALAKRYNISRIPIREAIQHLEQSGLLVRGAYRGLYVAELSIAEAQDLYEMRAYLEGMAARRTAESLSAEDRSSLETAFNKAYIIDSVTNLTSINDRCAWIHNYVIDHSNNKLCQEYYNNMTTRLERYKNLSRAMRGPTITSFREHMIIIESILANDAFGAEQAIRSHISISGTMTIQFLKEHGYIK